LIYMNLAFIEGCFGSDAGEIGFPYKRQKALG